MTLPSGFRSVLPVRGGASTRGAHEEIASIGEGDGSAICLRRTVLRSKAGNHDLEPGRKVGFPQPSLQECVGGACFDRPVDDLAIRLLDVHVQPSVWIYPIKSCRRPFQRDGLVFVKFRGKRVVCHQRCGPQKRADDQKCCPQLDVHRRTSSIRSRPRWDRAGKYIQNHSLSIKRQVTVGWRGGKGGKGWTGWKGRRGRKGRSA